MLTALVLQLIQCVVSLPHNLSSKNAKDKSWTEKIPDVSGIKNFRCKMSFKCNVK